jgi:TrmH family RNA methyltransferase
MRRPELVTSPANPLLKDVRKAISRGGLTSSGWCVAETFHLLVEALRSNCRGRAVIAGEGVRAMVESQLASHEASRNNIRIAIVPDRLLDAASQGVVALVEPPEWTVQQTLCSRTLVLIVDGVQDPGNLGTILRSAEAFGASGVWMLKGTVSPFNAKAARASAGSVLRVPWVQGLDESTAIAAVRGCGAELYAAVPQGRQWAGDADLSKPCAMVIGSEGHGVSAAMRDAAKELSIPTTGVESLNAAVSAAILLYEARRQRSVAHEPV